MCDSEDNKDSKRERERERERKIKNGGDFFFKAGLTCIFISGEMN